MKHETSCDQCDQIGRFIALWATFLSLWLQLFCPNFHICRQFLNGVKIFHYSSEISFGPLFIHFWRLFWSNWLWFDIFNICLWHWYGPPGDDPGMNNQKTPTMLLLTPDGKFHAFGFTARDFYNDLDQHDRKNWFFFERFKMNLHHDQVHYGISVLLETVWPDRAIFEGSWHQIFVQK